MWFFGAWLMLPVVVLFGLMWFVDTLQTHAEERMMQQPDTQGWSPPRIPQCDKPLWERIKDRCAGEDND